METVIMTTVSAVIIQEIPLEDDLIDVWLRPMERYRNFQQFTKCSKCELLPYCRGCPAVAYGAAGDFYGADPQCWKII